MCTSWLFVAISNGLLATLKKSILGLGFNPVGESLCGPDPTFDPKFLGLTCGGDWNHESADLVVFQISNSSGLIIFVIGNFLA